MILLSPVPGRSFVAATGTVYTSDANTGLITNVNSQADAANLIAAGCTQVYPPPTNNTPIDVFLIAGQSNAVGNGQNVGVTPKVNTSNCLQYYSGALSAANDPVGNSNGGSAWPAFCQTYFQRARRAICVVPAAAGSTAQEAAADTGAGNWDTGGTLVTASLTALSSAIAALQAAGWSPNFMGVLWCQGEQDAEEINISAPGCSKANYKTAFYNMVKRYQTAYPGSFFYVFRTGVETNGSGVLADSTGWIQIRTAQEELVYSYHDTADANVQNVRMVFRGASSFADFPAPGLGTNMLNQTDHIHYTNQGYNLMGHHGALAVLDNDIRDDGIVLQQSTWPNIRFRTDPLDSGNRLQSNVSYSYTTTSTSYVMCGFGQAATPWLITPRWSGKVRVRVTGMLKHSVAGSQVSLQLCWSGSVSEPAAGAALAGTLALGQQLEANIPTANGLLPFAIEADIGPLAYGNQTWFDLAIIGPTGTTSVFTCSVLLEEL